MVSASRLKQPAQNLVEKIVQRFTVNNGDKYTDATVKSGQFVSIQPHHVMTHDNTAAVMLKFNGLHLPSVFNRRQPVFTLDHDIQNTSQKTVEKYAAIQQFANQHGVDFYPAGRGIGHQIMIEEGYAWPQTLTVASDSHTNMYGGLGVLGTPVVRTDAAAIWATGRTWWQVPPVVKVELSGQPAGGVTGKDIIVALCGLFNRDDVLNCALEFHGDSIQYLPIDDRLTIANMTTEWGAIAGIFPVDQRTIDWLTQRARRLNADLAHGSRNYKTVPSLHGLSEHPRMNSTRIQQLGRSILKPDPDAYYAKHLKLDLSTIRDSFVSGPNSVKTVTPLSVLARKKIRVNKAYLLSCTNSRLSDIRQAADVFRMYSDRQQSPAKVCPGVEFYVAAASSEVEADARASGDWQVLMDAGAKPLPAGCGPCIGLGIGLLQDGEVGISATNRNFKGRMGSRNAEAYLASPAVVASSAIVGRIAALDNGSVYLSSDDPHHLEPLTETVNIFGNYSSAKEAVDVISGFPASIEGEIIYCPADNMNTDAIYPGKYTYREDLSAEQMARVAMENYDEQFSTLVKPNDILVSGANFGSGSSREQAATCLKHAGIQLVIAKSFSETYKRNALNNSLLCLESREFVHQLQLFMSRAFPTASSSQKTFRTGVKVRLSFVDRQLEVLSAEGGKKGGAGRVFQQGDGAPAHYKLPAVGRVAQELLVAGGLESWILQQIDDTKTEPLTRQYSDDAIEP